jgi:hypothetical protein
MQTGGCLCGAVRYRIDADPIFQFACHCRDCQRATGGSPTYGVIIPKAGLTITEGEPRGYASHGDSGAQVERQFCGACGSPLFSKLEAQPDLMVVKVGSLDNPSFFKVGLDMWMSAAQPWHRPHEGAIGLPGNPPS